LYCLIRTGPGSYRDVAHCCCTVHCSACSAAIAPQSLAGDVAAAFPYLTADRRALSIRVDELTDEMEQLQERMAAVGYTAGVNHLAAAGQTSDSVSTAPEPEPECRPPSLGPPLPAPMRRPPASMLGDADDDAVAPPTPQASGGAPPPLAGAKKSLGDPGGPSKCGPTTHTCEIYTFLVL
jgi:hypothetical protein